MTAHIVEITSRTPVSKPELTTDRKAQLFDKAIASIKFMAGQLEISRDANIADRSRAAFFDSQVHECYVMLWRLQQVGAMCTCRACAKERVKCEETGRR